MLTHGERLVHHGTECSYWFCEPSWRLPEFERTAPTTVAPMARAMVAVRDGRYDVVHVVSTDPIAELFGFFHPQVKVVATNHGALSEAWSSRNCFARTAVSAAQARMDQPHTDLEVEAIRNGVPAGRFAPPECRSDGGPIVAFVGRTRAFEQKDFPRFTRIAKLLERRGYRFWVADPHGGSWKDFAGKGCAEVELERWEQVPQEAMPGFYRDVAASGGVLLMTSRFEGLTLVPLEAAMSGLGTIAPSVPGVDETVRPGITGMLYALEDSDASVAERVVRWIENQGRDTSAMLERAELTRADFSDERMTQQYLDLYARSEQRVHREAAHLNGDAGARPDVLVRRLRASRRVRAMACRAVARDLANAGEPGLAWRTLRHAISVEPRVAIGRASTAQALGTLLRIARSGLGASPLHGKSTAP